MSSQKIFRVACRKLPYSQLGNEMIRDKRVSPNARFALVFILTYPPDWTFSQAWLSRELDIGRNKTYALINELVLYGYCQRERKRRNDGKLGTTEYIFTDEPSSQPRAENRDVAIPDIVAPRPCLPDVVNQAPTKKQVLSSQSSLPKSTKERDTREEPNASLGTDGASGEQPLPFSMAVIAELTALGCDAEALIAKYAARTKGRRVRDPNAYLLQMGRDEIAKRLGVSAEHVKNSNSKNRHERIEASSNAVNAFSKPSPKVLARASRCKHFAEILDRKSVV